jgi:hypothetical protein
VNFRGPQGSAPKEADLFSSFYNPKRLDTAVNSKPKLIWPSLRHDGGIFELDSPRIPKVDLIGKRRSHNTNLSGDAQLLGCVEFWSVVRQSSLIFIFDRYMSADLLRRLRTELTPATARNLETLLLIGGTRDNAESKPMISEIQNAYATVRRSPKIFYVDGMKSNEAPFPHDRFAVTDGEFWHFGGTAGGIEGCLTALSRGWKAKDVGVQGFIDEVWAALPEKNRVHA